MNDRRRFLQYSQGYADLWHTLEIRDNYRAHAEDSARRILANRARYEAIEAQTTVPWWLVGLIHKMESNLNFRTHLHNGDSLTRRTWRVPKGRPLKGSPPYTWEESAIDALVMKGMHRVGAGEPWSLESVCYYLERYNGFGYRPRGINTPYLWSGSQHHTKGKYVADHVFDPNATSQQTGCMTVLRALMEMDPAIALPLHGSVTPDDPIDENETLSTAPESTLAKSRTVFGVVLATVGLFMQNLADWVYGGLGNMIEVAAVAAEHASDWTQPVVKLATIAGINAPSIGLVFVVAGLLYALYARVDANRNGKIG